MKVSAQEKYGSGPSLSTKHDRLAKVAFGLMFASLLCLFVSLVWT